MEVEVLGEVRISDAGATRQPSPSERRLISLLVIAGRPVTKDRIEEVFWPGSERDRGSVLTTLIHGTRRSLPKGRLVHTSEGYALALRPHDRVDLRCFEALVQRAGDTHDRYEAAELYQEAVSLWHDESLPDLPDTPSMVANVERLRLQLYEAREALATIRLSLGQHRQILPDLHEWVQRNPASEYLRRLLMLALYRDGRKAAALEVFEQGRTLLAGYDTEPGTLLRRMYDQICADDPTLRCPPTPSPRPKIDWRTLPEFTSRAEPARMLNFLQGGKDHYAVDRRAASDFERVVPRLREQTRMALAWRGRVIKQAARAGIRQFLDLGAGLPDTSNVHQVAREVSPDARVVYVDINPVIEAHARALLLDEPDTTSFVLADLFDAGDVLHHRETQRLIDFDQPVMLLATNVLHLVGGDGSKAMATYVDALSDGSYVAISGATSDDMDPAVMDVAAQWLADYSPRSSSEWCSYCEGLTFVDPGLVDVEQAHDPSSSFEVQPQRMLVGLAVK